MPRYRFGPVAVSLPHPTNVLEPSREADPEVRVHEGGPWDGQAPEGPPLFCDDPSAPYLSIYRDEPGFFLVIGRFLRARVTVDGRRVDARRAKATATSTWEHILLDNIIPRALTLQGHRLLHASAVLVDGEAIVFLGESGTGKSTLALRMTLDGHAHLSDDSLVVTAGDGRAYVQSTYRGLRLWPEDLKRYLPGVEGDQAVAAYGEKRCLLPARVAGVSFDGARHPIRRIYAMVRGNHTTEASAMGNAASLIELIRHSFRLELERPHALTAELDDMRRVSHSCRVRTLAVREGEQVEVVRDVVARDLRIMP